MQDLTKTEIEELNHLRKKEQTRKAVTEFVWYMIRWIVELIIAYEIFSFAIIGAKTLFGPLFENYSPIQAFIFGISALWLVGKVFYPWDFAIRKAIEWASPLLQRWKRQIQASSEAWVKSRKDNDKP